MYRIESTIVKRLKERNRNGIDLLQAHVRTKKPKTEPMVTYYEVDDETIGTLVKMGIDIEKEMIDAIMSIYGKGYEIKIVGRK